MYLIIYNYTYMINQNNTDFHEIYKAVMRMRMTPAKQHGVKLALSRIFSMITCFLFL